jgi:DNA-binding transcriptional LysR family regulator
LSALETADEELRALDGLLAGTIHLGASTAPGAYLLPDVLGCFRREYPGVAVEVEVAASGEILRRLLEGRVQLAVVGAQEADARIALEPFLEDEIIGVAKPGLLPLADGKLDPHLIADLTLLSREIGSSSRELVEAELRSAGVWPRDRWELGSPEAIKRAAREGLGVAFLSRYAVADEVDAENLESFRLLGRPPLQRKFFVARLGGRALAPSEREFVATLTRCCAKTAAYAEACVGVTS